MVTFQTYLNLFEQNQSTQCQNKETILHKPHMKLESNFAKSELTISQLLSLLWPFEINVKRYVQQTALSFIVDESKVQYPRLYLRSSTLKYPWPLFDVLLDWKHENISILGFSYRAESNTKKSECVTFTWLCIVFSHGSIHVTEKVKISLFCN